MSPFIGYTPPPTMPTETTLQISTRSTETTQPNTPMQITSFESATGSFSAQKYNVASFRMDTWEPSDAELEAAMKAYEEHPETSDEFKARLFELLTEDADGAFR